MPALTVMVMRRPATIARMAMVVAVMETNKITVMITSKATAKVTMHTD